VRYLLDTDFVIDYLTGQDHARAIFLSFLSSGATLSVITYSEIYEGIYGSRDPLEAERGFLAFLRGVRVQPISRAIAKRNASIRLDLRRRKHPITHRALDLVIAATALERDLELVTGNTSDYDDIPGLSLYAIR
jgi:tRNA(fMet)-specific endonuclease VapC